MAARGITQEMIDDRRQQPERQMLNDMKLLHQKGLPLDQRNPQDKSTFVRLKVLNNLINFSAPHCGSQWLLRRGGIPAPLWSVARFA